MKVKVGGFAFSFLLSGLIVASPSAALDMVGTWEVTRFKCKGVSDDGQKATESSGEGTRVLIGPNGSSVPAAVELTSKVPPEVLVKAEVVGGTMLGRVRGRQGKGAASFRDCDSPENPTGIYLKKVKTFPVNGKGISGTATGDTRLVSFDPEAGRFGAVCQIKLQRIDESDPLIEDKCAGGR